MVAWKVSQPLDYICFRRCLGVGAAAALVLFAAVAGALGVTAYLGPARGCLFSGANHRLHGAGLGRIGGTTGRGAGRALVDSDMEQGMDHVLLHPMEQFLKSLMALGTVPY